MKFSPRALRFEDSMKKYEKKNSDEEEKNENQKKKLDSVALADREEKSLKKISELIRIARVAGNSVMKHRQSRLVKKREKLEEEEKLESEQAEKNEERNKKERKNQRDRET